MINLDGKRFRSVETTENGDVDGDTVFTYRQQDGLISASYAGGFIIEGHLMGTILPDGRLSFVYHHVDLDHRISAGECISTPETLADGRVRLVESWQWFTGDCSQGDSIIEEIA